MQNIKSAKEYKLTRVMSLNQNILNTYERIESAKIHRQAHLSIKKAKAQSIEQKRDAKNLQIKMKELHFKKQNFDRNWLLFIVITS